MTNIHGKTAAIGIGVYTHIHRTGATATQTVTIADNFVSTVVGGSYAAGIGVGQDVGTDSFLTQIVSITGNDLVLNGGTTSAVGIGVHDEVWDDGLSQTVSICGNTVSGSQLYVGIGVGTFVSGNGSIGQNLTIASNQVGATRYAGIALVADVGFAGGTISQAGTVSGNSVAGATGPDADGLRSWTYLRDTAAAQISQNFTVTGNTFSNNNNNGVYIWTTGSGGAGTATGNWTLAGNVITNNGNAGVRMFVSDGPNVTDNLFLSSAGVKNTISGNAVGVYGGTSNAGIVNVNLGQNSLGGNTTTTSGNANFTNP